MTKSPVNREPTIVDVARAANVSVSTVSRVVRDHPDVRAATRASVQEVIDSMGYRPSSIARALVSGHSQLIALLVSDITNPFYPQLAKSVEQEAKKHGYTVVICNTDDKTLETRRSVERLLSQGLDGVIHASVASDEGVLLELLGDHRIVFTNRRPRSTSASYIVSDNEGGAAELTNYLLAQGHRRIGFIAGPAYASNAAERLAGFSRAMADVSEAESCIAEGDFSVRSGAQAVYNWNRQQKGVTAIIAINDSVALGALDALIANELRVPGDVALAGFDGVLLAASSALSLTTVDQHIDQMGRRSVRMLLRQLAKGEREVPYHEVLRTQLIIRASTGGVTGGEVTRASHSW